MSTTNENLTFEPTNEILKKQESNVFNGEINLSQEKNNREKKESVKSPTEGRIHFKNEEPKRKSLNGAIDKDIEAIDFKQNIVCDDDNDDDEKEECEFTNDAVETMNAEKIIESGYLYKRSTKLKSWKKRWFVLRGTKLAYYKNDKEYKLMSVIDLSTIHRVGKVNVSRPNVFGIVTLPRTYYVQGTSEEDVDNWIKSINELIKANGGGNNISHKSRKYSLSENQLNKTNPKENSGEMINGRPISKSQDSLDNNSAKDSNNNIVENDNNTETLENGENEINANITDENNNNNNTINETNTNNTDNNKLNDTANNNTSNTSNTNNTSNTTESPTKKKDNKPQPILTHLSDSESNGSSKVKFIQSASVVEYRTALPYSSRSGKSSGRSFEIKSARPYDENHPMIREDEGSSSEENLFIANPLTGVNLMNDNIAVRQGYLLRQSSKYKTWKKRWFVLRNGKLTCYKNEKEYVVISIIPLSETLDIIETEKPVSKSHKYCFKIITEGKTMILCAETEEDCNNWIKDLQKYHKIIQEIKDKNGLVE